MIDILIARAVSGRALQLASNFPKRLDGRVLLQSIASPVAPNDKNAKAEEGRQRRRLLNCSLPGAYPWRSQACGVQLAPESRIKPSCSPRSSCFSAVGA